jgi:protein-tyrosine phosphatase
MCQQAELILVMERGHQTEVQNRYPHARGKVFRLGHYGDFDVADPYRQPRPAFEAAYELIARGAADWAKRIRQLG